MTESMPRSVKHSLDQRAVSAWIKKTAYPLGAADPTAPADDLSPLLGMLGSAVIVGCGAGTRGAHELLTMQLRIAKLLVTKAGYRGIAFDHDWTLGARLDAYVCSGQGDVRDLLSDVEPLVATEEIMDLLQWMRAYNSSCGDDPVRLVGVSPHAVGDATYQDVVNYTRTIKPTVADRVEEHYAALRPGPDIGSHIARFRSLPNREVWIDRARAAHAEVQRLPLTSDGVGTLVVQAARVIVQFYELYDHADRPEDQANMAYLERALGENVARWQICSGRKTLFWTSSLHSSNGFRRAINSPPNPVRAMPNAGSILRHRFGNRYLSIGLTFHSGELATFANPARVYVAAPSPELAEAVLGADGFGNYLLDLRTERPTTVDDWLHQGARFRAIGPFYHWENDGAFHMTGGSPSEWFDVLIHRQRVTATHPIPVKDMGNDFNDGINRQSGTWCG